jgi:hypothetical protein
LIARVALKSQPEPACVGLPTVIGKVGIGLHHALS